MSGRKPDDRGLRNRQPFAVTVEFLSDWACGTGTTRYGAVDREVHRDRDGLPMLRGKTLVGMLRDAAETVVEALDEGRDRLWHDWLRVLFGDRSGAHGIPGARPGPLPAALVAHPLRLPEPVRAALADLDELSRHLARDATVTLRPGVQIDTRTGVAADNMFRVEERASSGLVVTADWQLSFDTLPPDAPVPWEAEFLLRAAARLVDAVGGKRRRGAGRCRVEVASGGRSDRASGDASGRPVDRLAELLALVDEARPPQVALPAAPDGEPSASPSGAGTVGSLGRRRDDVLQHRYDLRITALTPLLFVRGEIGNLVHTERFIPGTALLPALHEALGEQATELITSGRAIVTNATVEIDGRRSLPTPMALQQEKGRPDSALVNLLVPPSDGRHDDRRLRPWGGFCVATEAGIRRATPKLVEWAHSSIEDEPQRPTEDTGGFFVYEAIDTGTVLRAEVWLPADVSLNTTRLAGRRRIGRSRKDDYGLVDIEVSTPDPSTVWLRTGVASPASGHPDELVVWLLSDVLLRGAAGEPAADVGRFAEVLGEALGVGLRLPDAVDDAAEAGTPPGALVTFRRVESWQRRWSLPRPSLTGLGAGSVLRFQMVGTPPSAEAYRRVEACGVGERTAEGFGRVALAPELLGRETVVLAPPASPVPPQASPPVSSPGARPTGGGAPAAVPPLVVDLLVRGWSRELRRRVRERVKDPTVRGRLVPDNVGAAQLGTVRTIADRLAADDDPSALLGWIKATRNVLKRSAAWGTDRLDLLERLADGADPELWNLLGVSLPLGVPEVAAALHRPAYAWLLAEAAREQTVVSKGQGDVRGRMEARA